MCLQIHTEQALDINYKLMRVSEGVRRDRERAHCSPLPISSDLMAYFAAMNIEHQDPSLPTAPMSAAVLAEHMHRIGRDASPLTRVERPANVRTFSGEDFEESPPDPADLKRTAFPAVDGKREEAAVSPRVFKYSDGHRNQYDADNLTP